MELELLLTGEPGMLPGVRALAAGTFGHLELPEAEVRHLESLVVGAVSDALANAYPTDQPGPVRLTIRESHGRLELVVRDYGMPTDVELLEQSLQDSAAATLFGCPTALLDDVHWVAFGPQGKALQIRKWLRAASIADRSAEASAIPAGENFPQAPEQEYTVRRMRPHEAVQVSQLMYRAYGNTYFNPDVYYPQRIAAQNAAGSLVSYVACTDEGQIVGHCALELERHGPIGETGQAVVDPAHRGRGLLIRMKQATFEEARSRQLVGCVADAVAVHTLTQRSNVHHGGRLTCIDLGGFPRTERFRGIVEELPQRITCLMYFHWLATPEPRTIFVPPRHREIISMIYSNLDCPIEFGPAGSLPEWQGSSLVGVSPGAGSGFIRVGEVGCETVQAVRHARRKLTERSGAEAVFVELPLDDPATPAVVEQLETHGFGFVGIIPHLSPRGDMLRLTYLVEPLAREPIKTYDEFGARLVDYALAEQARVRSAS